jgi:hypothetical protein
MVIIQQIDIGRGIEEILVRYRIGGPHDAIGEVGVGFEVAVLVLGLELCALAVSAIPVELRQNHRLAELAVIDHVPGDLVVGIDPHNEAGEQFLVHTDVEIIGSVPAAQDC